MWEIFSLAIFLIKTSLSLFSFLTSHVLVSGSLIFVQLQRVTVSVMDIGLTIVCVVLGLCLCSALKTTVFTKRNTHQLSKLKSIVSR